MAQVTIAQLEPVGLRGARDEAHRLQTLEHRGDHSVPIRGEGRWTEQPPHEHLLWAQRRHRFVSRVGAREATRERRATLATRRIEHRLARQRRRWRQRGRLELVLPLGLARVRLVRPRGQEFNVDAVNVDAAASALHRRDAGQSPGAEGDGAQHDVGTTRRCLASVIVFFLSLVRVSGSDEGDFLWRIVELLLGCRTMLKEPIRGAIDVVLVLLERLLAHGGGEAHHGREVVGLFPRGRAMHLAPLLLLRLVVGEPRDRAVHIVAKLHHCLLAEHRIESHRDEIVEPLLEQP